MQRTPGLEADALDIEAVGRGVERDTHADQAALRVQLDAGQARQRCVHLFCGSAGGCGELLCGDRLARDQQFQQRLGQGAEIGCGRGPFEGGIEPGR